MKKLAIICAMGALLLSFSFCSKDNYNTASVAPPGPEIGNEVYVASVAPPGPDYYTIIA